jgi:hypothetical protein
MAAAFKCDRCERYEDDNPVAGVTFNMPEGAQRRTDAAELCSRCLASLKDWLDYYKNTTFEETVH